jgi:hypothetical protein
LVAFDLHYGGADLAERLLKQIGRAGRVDVFRVDTVHCEPYREFQLQVLK